jgi:valyl-tRNA synthetase
MSLNKTYEPAATEGRLYEMWEKSGVFSCDPTSSATPYTIMIPPPNVTGSLHMGHGLTFTIQDTLIRYARMKGNDTLWQPGTDHAGIATQMVVERELAKQGVSRREMGRKAFLDKVWEWKAQSGGTITKQLRRLGASLDWPRERFTMDPALNKAVNKVFTQLYREGLIYKDTRLVNWDPKMLSAISDLEVESKEIKGNLWYIDYPIQGTDEHITVATTRPETMLGDTAVAVHPDNEKLKHLIGKNVVLPLVGRIIPIVADAYADPEKGTGAVKITPAHDFNDFEVGKRHKLAEINIFTPHAKINDNAPEKYRGMDRFDARKQIVADLEEAGLLVKIEPHIHAVPHGDRSGVPIEPFLSEQWYCDAKTLAQPAITAVEEGRTKFVPQQWENTFFAWLRNIEPWCISRQLWWGHQIPAWYGPDQKVFVAETEAEAQAEAEKHYGQKTALTRDEDVLDTWFSSALWPFTTLGWPEDKVEVKRYYPTNVLVTGFDIIFFWVARMMMMGLHFMKDVPFRTVYMHALVRDEKGQKMSKTKGNVIDPLDMIEKYGCDALRFTLTSLSTPGRDIKLAPARIEGNRNFVTKLWNAARFCEMNGATFDPAFTPATLSNTVNRWIVGEAQKTLATLTEQLDAYRFDLSSSTLYEFIWNVFCDWYLEFAKPIMTGDDEAAKAETRATMGWVLRQTLIMAHPFLPYVTESLWQDLVKGDGLLMTQRWPEPNAAFAYTPAQAEMNWVVRLITTVRGVRSELNVPAGAQIPVLLKDAGTATKDRLATHEAILKRLARVASFSFADAAPKGSAQAVLDEATLILPLADIIDLAAERARLGKEADKLAAEIKKIDAKLANKSFVDKAPEDVVAEQRDRKAEAEAALAKLETARKTLAG